MRKDFENAGEDDVFPMDQLIVTSIEDFSSRGFWKDPGEVIGRDREKTLRLAPVCKAGTVEDGAEWGVACEDDGAEIGGERSEMNFYQAVFDGILSGVRMKSDFAEIGVSAVLELEDF